MKKFSGLFLVSLLSGATTLGAYKLFIDDDGILSNHKNTITTSAPSGSYARPVGLTAENLDFTSIREREMTLSFLRILMANLNSQKKK